MACYIAKCSNDKLGINHKNRVVHDVSERIKNKFEKLSSKSRTSALWVTYHGFICLITDFIRAERLYDSTCIFQLQQVEVSTIVATALSMSLI